VAGQILLKGVAKKATTGSFGFASQPLGPLEDVFGNGNSSFHTRSITALVTHRQTDRAILMPGGSGKVRAVVRLQQGALLVPQRAVTELQGGWEKKA